MPPPPAAPALASVPAIVFVKLVLMALFWAGAFVVGRRVVEYLEPFSAAAVRFVFAAVFLSALVALARRKMPPISKRQILALALLGMSGVFAYNALFFEGLKTITAAKAALILAANPVLIALAAAALFREKTSPARAVGIVISLIGVVAVVADGDPVALLTNGAGRGETAMLGAMGAWAFYSLLGKRVLRDIPPLSATRAANAFGAVFLISAAWGLEEPEVLTQIPLGVWLALLFLGVVASGVANTWYYQGIARVGAARAANFINLVPVFAAILGWIFLDETLSAPQLFGGALVILGVMMVNRRENSRPAADNSP